MKIIPTPSGQLEMPTLLYANSERPNVRELRQVIKKDTYTNLFKGKESQSIGVKQQYPL
jgi:hypothetical protein